MPNYISNIVRMKGLRSLPLFSTRAPEPGWPVKEFFDFDKIIPMPEMTDDWYGWRVSNWGTKWNSFNLTFLDDDTIRFNTAWNCPEPVIRKLSELYPYVEIEHWWADENYGFNSGRAFHFLCKCQTGVR